MIGIVEAISIFLSASAKRNIILLAIIENTDSNKSLPIKKQN
jgi:hypothetical protein